MLDFFIGENNNELDSLLNKLKEMNKYKNVIIIDENDQNNTTAIIRLNNKNNYYTKSDFVSHLPKMKKLKGSELNGNNHCTICQSNVEIGEYYRVLPGCKHTFHKKCVDQWFFKSKDYSCPLCRHNHYKDL